jgi:uncharacterized phosphosugar-binding protein
MSSLFLPKALDLIKGVIETQDAALESAAASMAQSVSRGRAVYFYGSGHSTLPVLDVFPRYGSFVGLQPVFDPRLMWFNVLGSGGVRELLWLERKEGYAAQVLQSYHIGPDDTVVVYSHGGINAAPVEAARYCHEHGATVIGITSSYAAGSDAGRAMAGKRLIDLADICIDTHAPAADAAVEISGLPRPVSATSTVLAVAITMELVARTARRAVDTGSALDVFASPMADGGTGNESVFAAYAKSRHRLEDADN